MVSKVWLEAVHGMFFLQSGNPATDTSDTTTTRSTSISASTFTSSSKWHCEWRDWISRHTR
jgi:hypothetical protein